MTSDRLESVLKALGLEIQHHDHPPGSGNYETCPGDIATSEEEQPGEPVEGAA